MSKNSGNKNFEELLIRECFAQEEYYREKLMLEEVERQTRSGSGNGHHQPARGEWVNILRSGNPFNCNTSLSNLSTLSYDSSGSNSLYRTSTSTAATNSPLCRSASTSQAGSFFVRF